MHPRDTFILFAAAHGKSEAGRYYLIPQDYDGGPDPEALAKRAIDQSMLQDWLANRIKARKALILLDTCESAPWSAATRGRAPMRRPRSRGRPPARGDRPAGAHRGRRGKPRLRRVMRATRRLHLGAA